MTASAETPLLPCPFCGGKGKLSTGRAAEDAEFAQVQCKGCGVQTDYFEDAYAPRDDAIAAWNRRAAAVAQEQVATATPMQVKPLEWRKGYCDDRVTIQQASFNGLYQIRLLDGVVWLDWPAKSATEYPTIEAARAAAQADYERRINSALVTATAEPVCYQFREAARTVWQPCTKSEMERWGAGYEYRALYAAALVTADDRTALLARIAELEALNADAVKVIEPFAVLANEMFRVEDGREMNSSKPDDHPVWGYDRVYLTTGHLRAARAFIAALAGAQS